MLRRSCFASSHVHAHVCLTRQSSWSACVANCHMWLLWRLPAYAFVALGCQGLCLYGCPPKPFWCCYMGGTSPWFWAWAGLWYVEWCTHHSFRAVGLYQVCRVILASELSQQCDVQSPQPAVGFEQGCVCRVLWLSSGRQTRCARHTPAHVQLLLNFVAAWPKEETRWIVFCSCVHTATANGSHACFYAEHWLTTDGLSAAGSRLCVPLMLPFTGIISCRLVLSSSLVSVPSTG